MKRNDSFSDIQEEPAAQLQREVTGDDTGTLAAALNKPPKDGAKIPDPITDEHEGDEDALLLPRKFSAGGQMRQPSSNQSLPGVAEPDVIPIKNPDAIKEFSNNIINEVMVKGRLAHPLFHNKGWLSVARAGFTIYAAVLSAFYSKSLIPFAIAGAPTIAWLPNAEYWAWRFTLIFNVPLTFNFVEGSFDVILLENQIFNVINESLVKVGKEKISSTEKNRKHVLAVVLAAMSGYIFADVGGKEPIYEILDLLSTGHMSHPGGRLTAELLDSYFKKAVSIPAKEIWNAVRCQKCCGEKNQEVVLTDHQKKIKDANKDLTLARAKKYGEHLESVPYHLKGKIKDAHDLFHLMVSGKVDGEESRKVFPAWRESQSNKNLGFLLFLGAAFTVAWGLIGLMFDAEEYTLKHVITSVVPAYIFSIACYFIFAATVVISVDDNVDVMKKDVIESTLHRFSHPRSYSLSEHFVGFFVLLPLQVLLVFFSMFTSATVDGYNKMTRQKITQSISAEYAKPMIASNKASALGASVLFNMTGLFKLIRKLLVLMVLGKNHWGERVSYTDSDGTQSTISFTDAFFNAQGLVDTMTQGANVSEVQQMVQKFEDDYAQAKLGV